MQGRKRLGALMVLVGLLVGLMPLVAAPAFADGNDSPQACTALPLNESVNDDDGEVSVPAGYIITAICIKSGNDTFGNKQHSDLITVDGTYGDGYTVTGLGTFEVKVSAGRNVKDISHIDYNKVRVQVDVPDGECKSFTDHNGFIPGSYDFAVFYEGGIVVHVAYTNGQDINVNPQDFGAGSKWDRVDKCNLPEPDPDPVSVGAEGVCLVGDQGVAFGRISVTVDPSNGATLTIDGQDFLSDDTFDTGTGDFPWSATAADGFEIEGDASGTVTIPDCTESQPEDKVVEGEWEDGEFVCGDTTVEQSRTVSTTVFVWDAQEGWVEGETTVEKQTQIRDLSEDEIEECPIEDTDFICDNGEVVEVKDGTEGAFETREEAVEDCTPPTTPPTVPPTTPEPPVTTPEPPAQEPPTELPFTGPEDNPVLLASIAAGLMAAGALGLFLARRREETI